MAVKPVWFVSRQHYWGVEEEDARVVEIAYGGLDYANPDMLVSKYPGEGEEYHDPREAAEAAMEICRRWRKDAKTRNIYVAVGFTHGATMPFEGTTFEEIRKWAQKEYESIEKCPVCGEPIGEEWWIHTICDSSGYCDQVDDGYKYCSEEHATEYSCDICGGSWGERDLTEDRHGKWVCPECLGEGIL